MKKIAKVLLTLGVLLMVPAGLSAGPTFSCVLVIPLPMCGPIVITQDVPSEAVGALEAAGWVCTPPCGPPDCEPL